MNQEIKIRVEDILDELFKVGPLSALGDYPRDKARENFRRILTDLLDPLPSRSVMYDDLDDDC